MKISKLILIFSVLFITLKNSNINCEMLETDDIYDLDTNGYNDYEELETFLI